MLTSRGGGLVFQDAAPFLISLQPTAATHKNDEDLQWGTYSVDVYLTTGGLYRAVRETKVVSGYRHIIENVVSEMGEFFC